MRGRRGQEVDECRPIRTTAEAPCCHTEETERAHDQVTAVSGMWLHLVFLVHRANGGAYMFTHLLAYSCIRIVKYNRLLSASAHDKKYLSSMFLLSKKNLTAVFPMLFLFVNAFVRMFK